MNTGLDEPRQIFRFLMAAVERGERSVLVTVANVTGSSSRAVGTHFAVVESGGWCGSISGGCIEAAVAGEAIRVLRTGMAEVMRFGVGSPLIDIRLPCGGGLDLLFLPDPDPAAIARLWAYHETRQSGLLAIELDGAIEARPAAEDDSTVWDGARLQVRHDPVLRLAVFGQGAEIQALARQALAFGADAVVHAPTADGVAAAQYLGAKGVLLTSPDRVLDLKLDRYTAAILLFHDHDWENGILTALLKQPALMIGAMGSPATHRQRLDHLRQAGRTDAELARVIGPVGLIPSTRDPALLALSIMAQVGLVWSQRHSG